MSIDFWRANVYNKTSTRRISSKASEDSQRGQQEYINQDEQAVQNSKLNNK